MLVVSTTVHPKGSSVYWGRACGGSPTRFVPGGSLQKGPDRQWCGKVVEIASGFGMLAPAPSLEPSSLRSCAARAAAAASRCWRGAVGRPIPHSSLTSRLTAACHAGADRYRCAPWGSGWCCTRLTLRAKPAASAPQPARNARGQHAFALQANAKTKATGPAAHRRASLGTHDIRQGEEVLVAQGARWRRAGAPQGHVASDAHR